MLYKCIRKHAISHCPNRANSRVQYSKRDISGDLSGLQWHRGSNDIINSIAAGFLIQAHISDGGDTIEEEKILRTCEELLAGDEHATLVCLIWNLCEVGGALNLQAESDVPVSILVVLLEDVRHPL